MIKEFLIKILFKLLDQKETYRDIDDSLIENWLKNLHQDAGFVEYCRKRDLQLLKTIRANVGKEDALILLGQNLELMRLMQEAKRAFEAKKKNKKVGAK